MKKLLGVHHIMFSLNRPDVNLKTELISFADTLSERVQAIGGYDYRSKEIVIKVLNGTGQELSLNIELNACKVSGKGRVITLSAASDKLENSFDYPELIVPIQTISKSFSNNFLQIFKPYSFTILRVKAKNIDV